MRLTPELKETLYEMAENNIPISLKSLLNTLCLTNMEGKTFIEVNREYIYCKNGEFQLGTRYEMRSSDKKIYNVAMIDTFDEKRRELSVVIANPKCIKFSEREEITCGNAPAMNLNDTVYIVYFISSEISTNEHSMNITKFKKDIKSGVI